MTTTATHARREPRTLLAGPTIVAAPGCADPLTARLVQRLGLPAVHASGSAFQRSRAYGAARGVPGGWGGYGLAECQALGVSCAILPGALQIAALLAQAQLLRNLVESGSARASLASLPGSAEMSAFYNGQGTAEVQALERRFGGAEASSHA